MSTRRHPPALLGLFLPGFLLGALLVPGATEAQVIPSPYQFIDHRHEAGPFLAVVPGNRGELELGPGGGTLLGGRYSIELGGPFALEATSFFLSTDRRVRFPGEEGRIEDLGATDVWVGGLDGRIRFTFTGARTWNDLAPFVMAGGGVVGDLKGRGELEEEFPNEVRFRFGPSFLGTLGTGVRWLPGTRFTVRGDATLNLWKLGTPDAFIRRDDELGPIPQQEWSSVPSFTVGLSYRF